MRALRAQVDVWAGSPHSPPLLSVTRLAAYLTYVPTYTVAEPAGDRAHLTAHHLRLPFLLSNTGRFSFFFFLQHNRERERGEV